MSAPNIEGTSNPATVTGGAFGTKVANATTETVGFYGATGVAKQTTNANVAGFAAGGGTASKSDSVWTGGVGSTTYTVGDVVKVLKNLGLIVS